MSAEFTGAKRAELLREAALSLRERADAPPSGRDPALMRAVAEWLDQMARHLDRWLDGSLSPMAKQAADSALNVARTYLGRDQ